MRIGIAGITCHFAIPENDSFGEVLRDRYSAFLTEGREDIRLAFVVDGALPWQEAGDAPIVHVEYVGADRDEVHLARLALPMNLISHRSGMYLSL